VNRFSGTCCLLLPLAALLLWAGPAGACNVPVFRYALERWRPQPYEALVFHRGPLGLKDRKAVRALEESAGGEAGRANLEVELVDLDREQDESLRKILAAQERPVLPWVVVRSRDVDGNSVTAWSGRLSEEAAACLLDSPARREVVRRIRAGETAVWLLLEGGDAARDDVAARTLEAELERLTPLLKLPKLTDAPDDRISEQGPPLRVAFSVLRLKRDDPAERMLVSTLLASEEDLPGRKEPMAFAVFGRGHCLAALVGRGLNADNVGKACSVLLAPCTCEVQGKLARFELLAGDWNIPLVRPADSGLPDTDTPREGERVPLPAPRAPSELSLPAPPVTADVEESGSRLSRQLLLPAAGLAALLVAVTGAWALRPGRRGSE